MGCACASLPEAEDAIPITTCRVCGHRLFDRPLLRYRNMPKSAQLLPGVEDLPHDRGVNMDIRQCTGCGLVQLDSEPVPYYREVIRAAAFSPDMAAFRYKQFADFVRRHSLEGKRVVEIGCGRGEYLSIMQRCGVEAQGVEYSPDAVASAVASGLRVTRAYAGDDAFALDDAPFDAFFILNFLEHLPDLNAVLDGIRRNLAIGGLGLVEVPNFDMILRSQLFAEFVTDHLFYFTRETLTATLKLNGFDIVECADLLHDYIISAVVRHRGALDISSFDAHQRVLQQAIETYLRRFGPRRVAIWGAGHQALAVMALCGLGGRIRYVVDSAVFKQGRNTPATHIPIVPPERLRNDPVDAVIVMAGGYSDEVAAMIRNTWAPDLEVAILGESGLEPVRR